MMPVKKHDNKKNAPVQKRDSAKVPRKEEALQPQLKTQKRNSKVSDKRVNALTAVGKKKRPSEI